MDEKKPSGVTIDGLPLNIFSAPEVHAAIRDAILKTSLTAFNRLKTDEHPLEALERPAFKIVYFQVAKENLREMFQAYRIEMSPADWEQAERLFTTTLERRWPIAQDLFKQTLQGLIDPHRAVAPKGPGTVH